MTPLHIWRSRAPDVGWWCNPRLWCWECRICMSNVHLPYTLYSATSHAFALDSALRHLAEKHSDRRTP